MGNDLLLFKKGLFFFNRLSYIDSRHFFLNRLLVSWSIIYHILMFWKTVFSDTGRCFMKLVFLNRVRLENLGLNDISEVFTVECFLGFDMPICFVNFQCRLLCIAFLTLFNTKSCLYYVVFYGICLRNNYTGHKKIYKGSKNV